MCADVNDKYTIEEEEEEEAIWSVYMTKTQAASSATASPLAAVAAANQTAFIGIR